MPAFKLRYFSLLLCALVFGVLSLSAPQSVDGYQLVRRWLDTAYGSTGADGTPATITWSIVPDSTPMLDLGGSVLDNSNLVGALDAFLGSGPGGSDLTQRPWFIYFESAFARWSELGGVTFEYEAQDDGTAVGDPNVFSPPGILGTRGDIRIGGFEINTGSPVNGYAYLPPGGDIALNTGEPSLFTNPTENHIRLRHVIMHELGHSLGLGHVLSDDSEFLLERVENTNFDGPQVDDIRGLHRAYGDRLEKANGGSGNNLVADATPLGLLGDGATLRVGADADDSTRVEFIESDFVSIDSSNDFDYFSFTVTDIATLDVRLTPQGPTYLEGAFGQPQSAIASAAVNDLSLAVIAPNGINSLEIENVNGLGGAEEILGLQLDEPGQYFVRVRGLEDEVQFYSLDISATYVPEPMGWSLLCVLAPLVMRPRRSA